MSYKKVIRLVLVFTFLLINLSSAIAINTEEYFPGLKPDADGRIETLNNEGGMAPTATGAEIWLLNDIKQQNTKNLSILEIGPAFGRLPIELFNSGFSGKYTAIDLSADHLEYLRTGLKKCPASTNHINTIVGRFPNDTRDLPDGSYDIIVVTHVFHFLEPEQFNQAVTELHRLLTKNGKIYLTAKTPYSTRYRSFIPVYEQRVRDNQENPGYINPVIPWVDTATITPERLKKFQGRHLYFFSKEDLNKIFTRTNFKVVKCEEMSLGYTSPIWQAPANYANREDAVILATKQ